MNASLTAATWFWLLVPMLTCLVASLITWLAKK